MSNACSTRVKRTTAGLTFLLAALGMAAETQAQIGHPPESSPYQQLRAKRVISAGVGYLWGSAGSAGVGPTDGPLVTARGEQVLSGALAVNLSVGGANLKRGLINPNAAPADSMLGYANQTGTLVDAGILLLLTGDKTWHRTVPYVDLSLGIAFGGSVPEDSLSGFVFKTQFTIAPAFGVQWYPSDRLMFRAEFRDIIWRLRYPPSFFVRPEDDPIAPPVLNPNVENDTQWTHHPTLILTIGYAIGF